QRQYRQARPRRPPPVGSAATPDAARVRQPADRCRATAPPCGGRPKPVPPPTACANPPAAGPPPPVTGPIHHTPLVYPDRHVPLPAPNATCVGTTPEPVLGHAPCPTLSHRAMRTAHHCRGARRSRPVRPATRRVPTGWPAPTVSLPHQRCRLPCPRRSGSLYGCSPEPRAPHRVRHARHTR